MITSAPPEEREMIDGCEVNSEDSFVFSDEEEDREMMTYALEMDAIRKLAFGRITDGASDDVLGDEAIGHIREIMATPTSVSLQLLNSPKWNGHGPEWEIRSQFSGTGKDADTVREGYNALPNLNVHDRDSSAIKGVKDVNNAIKKVLMSRWAKRGDVALDLCCGKGGDMHKWTDIGVQHVVFADFAKMSVEECKKRYFKTKSGHGQVKKIPRYSADFVVADCFDRSLQRMLPAGKKFDVVSCQMAFHYCFENQERARNAFWNVRECLKAGGLFLLTIPDSDVLYHRLMEVKKQGTGDGLSFGNSVYTVRFESNREFPVFNCKYWFKLTEAVTDLPEYLVPRKNLIELANRYQLELVETAPFEEYFEKYVDAYARETIHPSVDEKEVVSLYRVYVFRRI